jgi:branched-chain amino acid transport system substrate-binding protein
MQAGADLVNVVKQFNEFGLKGSGIQLAIGLLFDTDIAALGPDAFSGAVITTPWFWNLDASSRAWSARFERVTKTKPTFAHAGVYSATTQYLRAVRRVGGDNADRVVAALEGQRFTDFFARNATIRPQDHRVILDVYQVRVKPAREVKQPGDYYELLGRIPAAQAFTPLAESKCKMER